MYSDVSLTSTEKKLFCGSFLSEIERNKEISRRLMLQSNLSRRVTRLRCQMHKLKHLQVFFYWRLLTLLLIICGPLFGWLKRRAVIELTALIGASSCCCCLVNFLSGRLPVETFGLHCWIQRVRLQFEVDVLIFCCWCLRDLSLWTAAK